MSLIINGTDIPAGSNITYDGVVLERMICNGVEVWKKKLDPISKSLAEAFPGRTYTGYQHGGSLYGSTITDSCIYLHGHTKYTWGFSTGSFTVPQGCTRVEIPMGGNRSGSWSGGNGITRGSDGMRVICNVAGLTSTVISGGDMHEGNYWIDIYIYSPTFYFD